MRLLFLDLSEPATECGSSNGVAGECITKLCSGKASADTSYLCSTCYQHTHAPSLAGDGNRNTNNVNMSPTTVFKRKDANAVSVGRKRFSNLAEPEATDSLDGSSDDQFESSAPDTGSVQAAARMSRQNTLIDAGRSKFYTLTNEGHQLPGASPQTNRRMRSISDGSAHLTACSGSSDALNNEASVAHMNNADCIQRQRNATRLSAPPTADVGDVQLQLANSQFYVESGHLSLRGIRPSRMLRTVNNLHNEWQEKENVNQIQKNYAKLAPLGKEYTNEMSSVVRRSSQQANGVTESIGAASDYSKSHDITHHENLNDLVPAKVSLLKQPCKEAGCPYLGSIATDFYCSACFKALNKKLALHATSQLK